MPLYEYQCEKCGVFSAFRNMSESSLAVACESCGNLGERILSAPNFALVGKATQLAHERNERSAHEPKTMRRSSCGCSGSHTCNTRTNSATVKQAANREPGNGYQMQTKPSARPWMLGH